MNVVELNNIQKSFGELKILNGLNLHVKTGQVLGLFGHNGAGKTTTMKMILGLLKPTSGEIKVFGQTPFLSTFNHHFARECVILSAAIGHGSFAVLCKTKKGIEKSLY
jgi:ABC-type multidrug transport system ATPase subunit